MRLKYPRIAGLVAWAILTATAGQAQSFSVVTGGLNNPRGLAFAPNGDLYVVEAGSGGNQYCHVGPTGPRCFGLTGAVVRIDLRRGTRETVADGLPSLANQNPAAPALPGSSSTGPHSLEFQGQGNLYFTIGFGGDPALRELLVNDKDSMGLVARLLPNGAVRSSADLATFEVDNNPDAGDPNTGAPDSNPYGILALPGRRIVADAGANTLLEISANGDIRTLAVFREFRTAPGVGPFRDAVPTGVALGPDGAYYVGQLTGGPFAAGIARVFRVPPEGVPPGGTPEVYASGFTNIIDLEFGPDGSLYVLQIANPIPNFAGGALIRIAPNGTRTQINVPLSAPGGLAIGKDGTVYVTNNSTSPVSGQVLAIRP